MTRDAKIGMLTGLGVIVLIGVLLSEYLGGPTAGSPAVQNRMATLPIGSSYRDKVMQPVIAPGTVRTIAGESSQSGADPLMSQIAALPTAFATTNNDGQPSLSDTSLPGPASGDPIVRPAVTPVPVGQVLAIGNTDTAPPPLIQVGDTQPISLQTPKPPTAAAPKPAFTLKEYVILPGDTLSKIAKKFYQSSKTDDVQKIITANPTVLKDVSTMLVVGKKLMIPIAVQPAIAAVKPAPKADPKPVAVILAPGSTGTPSITAGGPHPLTPGTPIAKADAPKADAPKVDTTKTAAPTLYTVVDGDTLDKIAKKISAANYLDLAKQIASLNKIKDPRSLQVGMKLKLPAKS